MAELSTPVLYAYSCSKWGAYASTRTI